ncbi:MAG: hypothetical protein JNG85_10380 [Spirochaetaceae bacterium]|nr:hypothetical protein [Spirochaetaceae bacterium]
MPRPKPLLPFLATLLLSGGLVVAQEPVAARVLLLHSHYQGYAWTDSVTAGVLEGFAASGSQVDLSVAYLDSRRRLDAAYEAAFGAYIDERYEGMPPDLVIGSDNEALAFLSRRGSRVLESAPTVFCGVNGYAPELTAGLAEVSGVTEEPAMADTLRIALGLHPGTRRIAVFVGDNPTATIIERQFAEEVEASLASRLDFVHRRGLTVEDFAAAARREEPGSLIVLLNISKDSRGNTIDPRRAAREVSAASRVPVYSFWDFYLGHGIVGGRVVSGREQGMAAAAIGLRVLAGERASAIPVERGVPGPASFDWSQLERFGIRASSLPPGAVVIGRPPSFWDRHGPVLLVAGSVILGLGGFAAALLVAVARLRSAERLLLEEERSLRSTLEEKEVLLREVHHRVKNNLQIIASLLSLACPDDGEEPVSELLRSSQARIETMAIVHDELYDSDNFSRIDLSALAEKIGLRLQSAWESRTVRLSVAKAGPGPWLPLDLALPVALVIDELVGNSFAHAFPGDRPGRILVEAGLEEENRVLKLVVTDDGAGLPPGLDPSRASTIGFLIVRSLAAQLGAELSFGDAAPGLACVLRIPLDGRRADPKHANQRESQ